MASVAKQNKIADLSAKAEESLEAGSVFDAEREALKALMLARQDHDFQRMTTIIPTLMEARLKRLREAVKGAKISIVEGPVPEDAQPKKGCHLVQPPQVGADGRRLRLAAFERGTCVAVLCREPLTQLKLLPIVAISPGTTIRTQVRPPKNLDKPDLAWFTASIEALGDFAASSLDPDMIPQRRVDALLECLDALPEHEGLHHALTQACLEAQQAEDQVRANRAAKKAAQASRASANAAGDDDDLDDHDDEDGEASDE